MHDPVLLEKQHAYVATCVFVTTLSMHYASREQTT